MLGGNVCGMIEIGDGARDTQEAVVRAGREIHARTAISSKVFARSHDRSKHPTSVANSKLDRIF